MRVGWRAALNWVAARLWVWAMVPKLHRGLMMRLAVAAVVARRRGSGLRGGRRAAVMRVMARTVDRQSRRSVLCAGRPWAVWVVCQCMCVQCWLRVGGVRRCGAQGGGEE